MTYKCSTCGAANQVVSQCGCHKDNTPMLSPGARVNRTDCLEITCRDWFLRPDFLAFICDGNNQHLATWHRPGKERRSDYPDFSDVFVTFDMGEGSDTPDSGSLMPHDIWREITEICLSHRFERGVIHILATA